MPTAAKAPMLSGAIVVLEGSEASQETLPPTLRGSFADAPFATAAAAIRSSRSRLLDDADDFAVCRARRLRLEEQLAIQEEFRIVDSDSAAALRGQLTQIEKHVGEVPVDRLLAGLAAVQRQLYDDADEHEWW
jgi:hypothetical protein